MSAAIPTGDEDYLRQRTALRDTVTAAVRLLGDTVRLKGSFQFGDFHLDGTTGDCFSDIDLVADAASDTERARIAHAVSAAVFERCGTHIRASAHPHDGFDVLPAHDARYLSVAEYLRHAESASASYHNVLLAKVSLLVLRHHQAERYLDTVRRLDSPDARLLGEVKLGLVSVSAERAATRLLGASDLAEAPIMIEAHRRARTRSAFADEFASQVRSRVGVDPWVRNYIADNIINRRRTQVGLRS